MYPRLLVRGARSLRGRSVGVSLPPPSAQSPVRVLRGRGGGRSRWLRCPSPLRGFPSPPPPFAPYWCPPAAAPSLSGFLACVGCRSWGGCAAPPPSRPKVARRAPRPPTARPSARRLLQPPFVAYCGLTAANGFLHLGKFFFCQFKKCSYLCIAKREENECVFRASSVRPNSIIYKP